MTTSISRPVGALTACLLLVAATLLATPAAEAQPVRAERAPTQAHMTSIPSHPHRGDRSRFLCVVGRPCPPPCEIVQPCHTGMADLLVALQKGVQA